MSVGRADALPLGGGGFVRFKETVTISGGNEKEKSNGKIPEVARFSKESEGLLQWASRDSLWLRARWICQRHHSDLTYRLKITELFCVFSFFLTCHQAPSVLNRWVRSGAIKSKIINDCRIFFFFVVF